MLWYDSPYDDNARDNDVHSMMLMHSYTIWCTCIPWCDDALLCTTMYTWWWWCINSAHWDDDDAYLMMRMHTYDDDAYLWWWCMTMHALCLVKVEHNYLFNNCVWWGVQWCVHEHNDHARPTIQTWHGWWAYYHILMSSCDEKQCWAAWMSRLTRDWWVVFTSRVRSRDWYEEHRLVVQQSHMIALQE